MEFSNTPAGRVLKAIRRRGKATIREIAGDLGITPTAVRLHLAPLQARGAVRADRVSDGVGRPHFAYSATPEAHKLFVGDYGDLTRLLLGEVARTQGSEALHAVMRGVADGLALRYQDQVGGQELSERVDAWADLLDEQGVSVRILPTADGLVLEENGCPYYDVAVENRAVCEMERRLMSRLLRSGVRLNRCVLDGLGDCQFTVGEASSSESEASKA